MLTYTYQGKVAVVTGGASGMGFETVREFCKSGATVIMIDVSEKQLEAAAANLKQDCLSAVPKICDVTDESQVERVMSEIEAEFGKIDFAYNNAGIQSPVAETAEASGQEFDHVLSVNLRGIWNCMKYELKAMKKNGSGAIVNCSSLGGLVGIAGRGAYHASKHGVLGLTKSAALEYAKTGIRINAVCPGIIHTPMVDSMLKSEPDAMDEHMRFQPIGRLGQPSEIAAAVLWLCSPGASFVIGHALAVDGGYTIQ
ncbi:SDR family NAD(P)-dependent oxidoreductase [Pantoea endophytica]|uniref:SDR family NAD(P)-dependent oxidoreductase n=1 Tax=Pantoea endophytica TaxID=92488 RepID=UPI003017F485